MSKETIEYKDVLFEVEYEFNARTYEDSGEFTEAHVELQSIKLHDTELFDVLHNETIEHIEEQILNDL